jgi:hypothetical protein
LLSGQLFGFFFPFPLLPLLLVPVTFQDRAPPGSAQATQVRAETPSAVNHWQKSLRVSAEESSLESSSKRLSSMALSYPVFGLRTISTGPDYLSGSQ